MSETEEFLDCVVKALERLRAASSDRGHPMLASMIELAKSEAEDDRRTRVIAAQLYTQFKGNTVRPTGRS